MLTEKYKPITFADIIGQEMALIKIKSFLKNFPNKKSIILHGPVGTGKTSLAYVIAKEMNAEIIEINASDLRDKEQVKRIIGAASQQSSLFTKNKIMLVDEVDGITKDDRGGLFELLVLIDKTSYPIIITANDIWDKKFVALRRKSEIIELKEIHYSDILKLIKEVSKKEKLGLKDDVLKVLAIKANGDIRAVLNDLQTITEDSEIEQVSEREKEIGIFQILRSVLQEIPKNEILSIYDKGSMDLDKILLWLEENIPEVYEGEEIYNAFEALSKAVVFNGRRIRQQYWRFLVYQNILMSAGVCYSKKQCRLGFMKYHPPTRILKIWIMKQKNIYKTSIAQKYAYHAHISKKTAMKEFPILKQIIVKSKKIQEDLKLDNEEIMFLKKG